MEHQVEIAGCEFFLVDPLILEKQFLQRLHGMDGSPLAKGIANRLFLAGDLLKKTIFLKDGDAFWVGGFWDIDIFVSAKIVDEGLAFPYLEGGGGYRVYPFGDQPIVREGEIKA